MKKSAKTFLFHIIVPLILLVAFILIYSSIVQNPFKPYNSITKLVPAIQEISTQNEPIILSDGLDCDSAKYYNQPDHPVLCQNKDNLNEALNNNKIWLITYNNSLANSYDDYDLSDTFLDYVIISDVINGKIVALELEKTEK
ncbi:hypothetical protein IJG79_00025 [Candidatus Saccharibacteria bacterium]|nr:hypothetical protein [Candidatus Saccharibacteria bacterium]